jgi:hypothetical protein
MILIRTQRLKYDSTVGRAVWLLRRTPAKTETPGERWVIQKQSDEAAH